MQSLTANSDMPASADIDAGATTASVVPAAAPLPAAAAKQSYERAAKDDALAEAPQLRGADLMLPTTLSPSAGSAGGTAPVDSSVRAAYAMPEAVTTDASPAAAKAATAKTDRVAQTDAPAVASAASDTVDSTPAPVADLPVEPAAVAPEPVASQPEAPAAEATRPAASIADLQAGAARITSGVRLRGNPDNGAPTVGYLKPGAEVQVVQCKGWCEVVAGDKRGFVFKRFLAAL